MSVLQNMKHQSKFTSREKIVANYILAHAEQVTLSTVTTLAENTSTSLATVLRLIKKLGYNTYGEFKMDLTIAIFEQKNENQHNGSSKAEHLLDEAIDSINHTRKTFDYKEIEKSAQIIKNSTRIVITGYGVSYAVAYFLYYKLLKLGINVSIVSNSYEATAATINLKKQTAILVSGSGSSNNVLELAKNLKKNDNHVIILTNMQKSPLNKYSDVCLVGGIPDDQLNSGTASSRIALIMLSEYIVNELTSYKDLKTNLRSTNQELSKKEF